jgi:hypothetical protein
LEGSRELRWWSKQPIQSTTISLSMLGARCSHSVYRSLQTGSKAWPENSDPSPIGSTSIGLAGPGKTGDSHQTTSRMMGKMCGMGGNYVESVCRHDSLWIYVYGVGI